jgi:hypothetical protein
MKFVETYSEKDFRKDKTEELYDKAGLVVEDESSIKKEQTFAHTINIDLGNNQTQTKYFIKTYNGTPFDPNGSDSRREILIRTELKTVSKQTFDYYILYLQTKNNKYFLRTQRSYING